MNINASASRNIRPLEPIALRPLERARHDHGVVQASHASALRGHQIRVGDGVQRDQTISLGRKTWAVFKTVMKPFVFAVGVPVAGTLLAALFVSVAAVKSINLLGRLANAKIFEPRAERKYRASNIALLAVLEEPRPGSVINRRGGIGGSVKSRLFAHARGNDSPLERDEIVKLVAMGESIAAALKKGDGSLPLFLNGMPIASNTYTMRALCWYMMAMAASQDIDRKAAGMYTATSDMVTSGSILLNDPGGRIYSFISSAPTACSRMSTHFAERVAHDEKHKTLGFIPTGKPRQRGIEDYACKLPGEGGSMLFDQLKDDVLFVKIESCGCPPFFQQEPGQGVLTPLVGICRFFHALDRNVDHTLSFAYTRVRPPSDNVVLRQEHLHKGVLKGTVDKEFNALVQEAIASGVIPNDAKAIGKSAHKFGLPYVFAAIDQIRDAAMQRQAAGGDEELASRCAVLMGRCDSVLALTEVEVARAGGDRGIERRGFETHIALPNFGI
ncbi:MAG: hypothetical protein H7255_00245 [Ramlibacter sp.]|nr:hypothetical protein [Ramlibacter sp.]